MNLLEAIQGAGENWFRPKNWDKTGSAFSSKRNLILHHYCDGDSGNYICPIVSWLTGEWEIVTPEQVLSERKL